MRQYQGHCLYSGDAAGEPQLPGLCPSSRAAVTARRADDVLMKRQAGTAGRRLRVAGSEI
jgi:hypothetical protein